MDRRSFVKALFCVAGAAAVSVTGAQAITLPDTPVALPGETLDPHVSGTAPADPDAAKVEDAYYYVRRYYRRRRYIRRYYYRPRYFHRPRRYYRFY